VFPLVAVLVLAAVAVLAASAAPASSPSIASATAGPPTASGGSSQRSGKRGVRSAPGLPSVVLKARVFEPPRRWPPVFSVAFGARAGQLGSILEPGAPSFPKSFTVARDGSFWILDIVKGRLAHYSRRGKYLGFLRGGLRFDSNHLTPKDVVFVDGRLYVLEARGIAPSAIREVRLGGRAHVTSLTQGGRDLILHEFVPNQSRLTASLYGVWDQRAQPPASSGKPGIVWLEIPGSGQLHRLPGYPVRDGWISVAERAHDVIEVRHIRPSGATTTRRIKIEILTREGKRRHALVGPIDSVPLGNSLAVYLTLSSDAGGIGGRWYLQIAADGAVEAWEQLPYATIGDSSNQDRYMTAGPDGVVYYMLADQAGIEIFKRP
jgi:hypothetical protein